jgi:hypothetical protein
MIYILNNQKEYNNNRRQYNKDTTMIQQQYQYDDKERKNGVPYQTG